MFVAEAWADKDDPDIFAEVEANCRLICEAANLKAKLSEYRQFCDKLEGGAGRQFNALLRKWHQADMEAMCESYKMP